MPRVAFEWAEDNVLCSRCLDVLYHVKRGHGKGGFKADYYKARR